MNISGSSSGVSILASNLFNKLDTQQKGYLEQSDVQSALSSVSSNTTGNTDVSAVFAQLDTDSDGKVTQTELSNGLQTLADALQSQLQQSRLQGEPLPGADGFTQEELSAMANDSSIDSKGSDLMSKLAANFNAADTDGDGKINRDEAMAYEQTTRTDAVSNSATNAGTASSESSTLNLTAMMQLMQLLRAYGASSDNSQASFDGTLSVSA